jgi:hypothetical protein
VGEQSKSIYGDDRGSTYYEGRSEVSDRVTPDLCEKVNGPRYKSLDILTEGIVLEEGPARYDFIIFFEVNLLC